MVKRIKLSKPVESKKAVIPKETKSIAKTILNTFVRPTLAKPETLPKQITEKPDITLLKKAKRLLEEVYDEVVRGVIRMDSDDCRTVDKIIRVLNSAIVRHS